MNKAILLSINPHWCGLIAEGKKTIEVRKTKPKAFFQEDCGDGGNSGSTFKPFKCYIYCTIGAYYRNSVHPAEACYFGDGKELSNGKVIGEFICDEVYPIHVFEDGAIQNWNWYNLERACVPYDDMAVYIGMGKVGCGLHISDLTIYAQPKALSEFDSLRETRFSEKPIEIKRPPVSWCYVAERGE